MALDPQSKDALTSFTMIAKKIIYDADRIKTFMQLLGSPQGAVTAVQSVIAVIEKRKQIPPQILPMLGVNIYIAIVDVLYEASKTPENPKGTKPDTGIMKSVTQTIMQKLTETMQQEQQGQQPAPSQPQPMQAPQGIIGSAMQGAPA